MKLLTLYADTTNCELVTVNVEVVVDVEPAAFACEVCVTWLLIFVDAYGEPAALSDAFFTAVYWGELVAADAVLIHKVRAKVNKITIAIEFLFILPPPMSKYITN